MIVLQYRGRGRRAIVMGHRRGSLIHRVLMKFLRSL